MADDTRQPGEDDAEESPRYPFEVYRLGHFLELEFPPIEWIIPGLVPARSVTLLIAPPNAGKTLVATDWATQAAASGKRVMYLNEEGSAAGFQTRLRRSANAAGLRNGTLDNIEVAWNTGICLLEPLHLGYLIELVKIKKIEVLFTDSLAAVARGIDENDSRQMGELSEAVNHIKAETGCGVIAPHHMTKEAWKPGQTPTLANTRGHGTLAARADCVMAMVPLDAPAGLVRAELHCVKQRDAERAVPRVIEVLMTGDAAIITDGPLGTSSESAAMLLARALAAIPEPPHTISVMNLRKALGVKMDSMQEAVDLGIAQKQIGREHPRAGVSRLSNPASGSMGFDGSTGASEEPSNHPTLKGGFAGSTPNPKRDRTNRYGEKDD